MRMDYKKFKEQMLYLYNNGYETIRFDDFDNTDNLKFNKKRILIAFDDGWVSNYKEIFSLMSTLQLKYNVFLTIGKIGRDERYLTWDMVRSMHQSGLCSFGVHTYSHIDASSISVSTAAYEKEIIFANDIFTKELGFRPNDFCYPYGKYTEHSNKALLSNPVYERIYLSDPRFSYKVSDYIFWGRNGIAEDDSFTIFKNKCKGFYNVLYFFTK